MAIKAGALVSVLAFVVFQLFPRQILGIFANSDASEGYYEFGTRFFRVFLFFTWLNCLQPITSTFFTSIGKAVKGVFLSLTRQILFFMPMLLLLPALLGINGITFAGPVADILSGAVAVIMASLEFNKMKGKTAS